MNNTEIKKIILSSFNEKKNAHAFLFFTNHIANCIRDVQELLIKINCPNEGSDDCNCTICTTIKANTNPDVITIQPDGKEIKTNQILEMMDRFSSKPLINPYSMYMVIGADKMNDGAANKILKFLEEPEGNIVGFFITDNLSSVLPTIKSRCELYTVHYDANSLLDLLGYTEEEFQTYYRETLDLVSKLNQSPQFLLMAESKNLAKKERVDLEHIFHLMKKMYILKYENCTLDKYTTNEDVREILESIMTKDVKVIVKRINLLDNIINDFQANVNKELFINKLFLCWE